MAYATTDDVLVRHLGEMTPEAEAAIEVRLDDVEALIKVRIPDLQEKVSSGAINLSLVVLVESEAVLRLLRNPDGYTQETDGNYSYTLSAAVASGRLEIREDEWSLLGVRSGLMVLSPLPWTSPVDERHDAPHTAVWSD
ncbi:hypothetical protein HX744_14490 [Pseudonocardia sp. ICBG1122]|nr:hypothetical protein [Pseudonocardia pini]